MSIQSSIDNAVMGTVHALGAKYFKKTAETASNTSQTQKSLLDYIKELDKNGVAKPSDIKESDIQPAEGMTDAVYKAAVNTPKTQKDFIERASQSREIKRNPLSKRVHPTEQPITRAEEIQNKMASQKAAMTRAKNKFKNKKTPQLF